MSEFSWAQFFEKAQGGLWLESLRNDWVLAYDFVLPDSRTGLTDSGGVCTIQMPDVLTFVFTANEQSLDDGLRTLAAAQRARSEFTYDRPPLTVVPLLSRWEGKSEVDLGDKWLQRLDELLKPLVSSWLPRGFTPRQFLEKTCVPHVARFSFGEPLPVVTHSLTDPNLPGLAYDSLARLLDSRLEDAGRLIEPEYQPPRLTQEPGREKELELFKLVQDPEALNRELARVRQTFGESSPELAELCSDLGELLYRFARFAEAEPMMRRVLAIDEKSFGPDHPNVAARLNNLAMLLKDTNRLAEAEPMMRRALAIDEKSYGPEHPNVARDINNLALLLKGTNRLAEAEPLMRRAQAIAAKNASLHPQKEHAETPDQRSAR